MFGIITLEGGAPAAGIAVSNGRDVVLSDVDGRFELEAVTPFVVLSRPAGYRADPWWLPADSTAELRFELREHPQSLPFEFLHLTDTHMTHPDRSRYGQDQDFGLYREGSLPSEIAEFLRRIPERAPEAQAVFITGDLVDHGLDFEFEEYVRTIAESPLPVHLIPGNHDHMAGRHGFRISRNNYLTNEGDPALYEAHLGPRWYSFDIPGCHVVAMDWHSHELGIDHELQNAWVRADLARIPEGSPWILLFHDQPNFSILDEVPWNPVAAFSGHWHTSRVVDVDGTLHVNSPTSFFASLDYSPPAFRHVVWDGSRITMRTEVLPTEPVAAILGDISRATFAGTPAPPASAGIAWRTELGGAGHRQRVAVDGDLVVAGTQVEDEALGWVEALDRRDGGLLWRTRLGSAVKTTPAIAGDRVIVGEVSGDVHALSREDGRILWTVASSDPLRRFAWGAPTVAGDVVYLGDPSDLRAIDIATGEVIWRRTDLSPHHNLVNHGAPLVVDDLLVMGFWPTPQHPVGLDTRTGESRWAAPEPASGASFLDLKAVLATGTAVHDAEADAIVMPGFGATARIERKTGELRWITRHPGTFSPSSPLPTDRGYLATVTAHGLRMLDRESGATIWDLEIEGSAPFALASYSKRGHPVFAGPTRVGDVVALPGLDGEIRVIDLDGRLLGSLATPSPMASSLVPAGEFLLAIGTDGNVSAVTVESLLAIADATETVARS